MTLIQDQKKKLFKNGYIIISNLFNASDASNILSFCRTEATLANAQKPGEWWEYYVDLKKDLSITATIDNRIGGLIEELIGKKYEGFDNNYRGAQYAVTEPGAQHGENGRLYNLHIDGIPSLSTEKLDPYTIQLGVFLSDVTGVGQGGLRAEAGSHHYVKSLMEKSGKDAYITNDLISYNPDKSDVVLGNVGDAVLMLPLLIHGTDNNIMGNPAREVLYFRLRKYGVSNKMDLDDPDFYNIFENITDLLR